MWTLGKYIILVIVFINTLLTHVVFNVNTAIWILKSTSSPINQPHLIVSPLQFLNLGRAYKPKLEQVGWSPLWVLEKNLRRFIFPPRPFKRQTTPWSRRPRIYRRRRHCQRFSGGGGAVRAWSYSNTPVILKAHCVHWSRIMSQNFSRLKLEFWSAHKRLQTLQNVDYFTSGLQNHFRWKYRKRQ